MFHSVAVLTSGHDMVTRQQTETGLALQLSLQGTKYYKDDDLNKP